MACGITLTWCISAFSLLAILAPYQHVSALRHRGNFTAKAVPGLNFGHGQDPITIFFPGAARFEQGPVYRIPALLALHQLEADAKSQVLLAFAEKRMGGATDDGDIDVVMRRSEDGGKTWSPEQVVCNFGNSTCGNPAPVEDRHGKVHLLVSSNPWGKGETEKIPKPPIVNDDDPNATIVQEFDTVLSHNVRRRVWALSSTDGGRTWTKAKEITASVKHDNWLWYATGPGHGISLQHQADSKMNGRLVLGADHSEVTPGGKAGQPDNVCYSSHIIYSDDDGETWKFNNQVQNLENCLRANEASITEAKGGSVVLSSRQLQHSYTTLGQPLLPWMGGELVVPLFAESFDGGETWNRQHRIDELGRLPSCQGGLLNVYDRNGQDRLLFSHPTKLGNHGRADLRIYSSYDGGMTWPEQALVHEGAAGYSDMQVLADGTVALLFELGPEGIRMKFWKP